MKALTVFVSLFAVAAMAHPGSYEGKGTMGIPGKTKSTYTVKTKVTELVAGTSATVVETYQMEGDEAVTHVSTHHMDANGTVTIKRDGIKVGCGFCVPGENGSQWCDIEQQTDMGRLHINAYFDAKGKRLLRMGSLITLDGVKVWSDIQNSIPQE